VAINLQMQTGRDVGLGGGSEPNRRDSIGEREKGELRAWFKLFVFMYVYTFIRLKTEYNRIQIEQYSKECTVKVNAI